MMFQLRKILVPIDFSDASQLAFRYACELARPWQATIHLLHAADDPILFAETTSDVHRKQFIDDAGHRLAEWARTAPGDVQLKVMTRVGSAGNVIVELAAEQSMDLVVMGSHGHTKIGSVFPGSVAEHVLRNGPCPVLTLRAPDHAWLSADEGET